MKLTLHPTIIYRVPRFPVASKLEHSWPELKLAIADSSSDFYHIIQDIKTVDTQPEPIQETIWKYFNRARYRATPYGTFAGFGLCRTDARIKQKMVVASEVITHSYPDWTQKNVVDHSWEQLIALDCHLISNNTFYEVGDAIRFIGALDDKFELREIEKMGAIISILNTCKSPRRISEICALLPEYDRHKELYELVSYLLDNQLLLSEQHPNIIGQEYFDRISLKPTPSSKRYIIAERPLLDGQPEIQLFQHIPALIDKLATLLPPLPQPSLELFASRFQQKFERQQIPVMIALDPELGIGFDQLEQSEMDRFPLEPAIQKAKGDMDSEVKYAVIEKMLSMSGEKMPYIDLEDLKPDGKDKINTLPNTLGIICKVNEGRIIIESCGGSSANNMIGRFTLASQEVLKLGQQLATIETNANPEVLFFDVSYMAEGYVDNINRRKAIYDLQVNILTYDNRTAPLTLDDLYISVRSGEIILRSRRLNRRLIPRIASAYNYRRSDLPLFRFLWELQHQRLKTNLNFSLRELLPNLNYYPEVRFKNICVSPRYWRIRYTEDCKSVSGLKQTLQSIRITQYFKCGKADQVLIFDLHLDIDLNILLKMLRKENSLMLEEAHCTPSTIIADAEGNAYHHQFLLSYTHSEQLYVDHQPQLQTIKTGQNNIEVIGSSWLYFEIYCHSSRADWLLTERLETFIADIEPIIKKWFFIRYNENGDHLRLRINLKRNEDALKVIQALNHHIEKEMHSGIVSDLKMRIYKKELERYGADMMEMVEAHFSISSRFVLSAITLELPVMVKYRMVTELIFSIKQQELFDEYNFKNIINHYSSSFNTEHQFGPKEFKALNKDYQNFRSTFLPEDDLRLHQWTEMLTNSLIKILAHCPTERREKLFGDLIHMHVNRFFSQQQRLHEAAIYYFIAKELTRSMAARLIRA